MLQLVIILLVLIQFSENAAPPIFYLEVCEDDFIYMTCTEGYVVKILQVFYHSAPKEKCPWKSSTDTTYCSHPNAQALAEKLCNNRRECQLFASDEFFGMGICNQTYKYLQVERRCIPAPTCKSNEFRCDDYSCISNFLIKNGIKDCPNGEDEAGTDYISVHACQNEELTIGCPKRQYISIVNATYGRLNSDTCPNNNMITRMNSHCISTNALSLIKERCENATQCSIRSTNTVFGNPCVGTYKYLEAHYRCNVRESQCKPNENECEDYKCIDNISVCDGTADCTNGEDERNCSQLNAYVCNGRILNIKCPADTIIRNIDVKMNRNETYTAICDDGKQCNFSETLVNLSGRCDKTNQCIINESDELFPKICMDLEKYLHVQYQCLKSECEPNEYKCKDNKCIDNILVCDGTADCTNGEDERNCTNLNAYVCNGRILNITCPADKIIRNIDVTMNRNETYTAICDDGKQCNFSETLVTLSGRCDKTNQCIINESDELFPKICMGLEKYLHVHYQCLNK